MKHRKLRTWPILLLLLPFVITACDDKEEDIYGIFYADIVTCHTTNGNICFSYQATDAAPADTLYPVSTVSGNFGNGERILLQFRPIEQLDEHRKRIEIQALSAIHFDTLRVVAHDKMPQLPDGSTNHCRHTVLLRRARRRRCHTCRHVCHAHGKRIQRHGPSYRGRRYL